MPSSGSRYTEFTRFLRSERTQWEGLVVVAGTYHSGAEAIRRDVQAVLRLLRTDRLDVFFLFWVRSRERLDSENFEVLEALRAEGRDRTSGFSTHAQTARHEFLPLSAQNINKLKSEIITFVSLLTDFALSVKICHALSCCSRARALPGGTR